MRDLEKKRAYDRARYQANKEAARAYARDRAKTNPEVRAAKTKADLARRKADPEKYRAMRSAQCLRARLRKGINPRKHDAHIKEWESWLLSTRPPFVGPPKPTRALLGDAGLARWKMRNDPEYVIHLRMRVAIRKALRGAKAGRKWEELVGYTVHTLAEHLRRQLPSGYKMSDLFGGELHIDHIVPKVEFDVTSPDELRACWALSNLRPLPSRDNHIKHARRTHLL